MEFFTLRKYLFLTLIFSTFILGYPTDWDTDGDGFFDNITDYQNSGSISLALFNEFGEQLSNQIKQLDEFEVRTLEETVEVSINQVKYGICNQNNAIDELYCSTISVSKYGKPKLGRQIGQR